MWVWYTSFIVSKNNNILCLIALKLCYFIISRLKLWESCNGASMQDFMFTSGFESKDLLKKQVKGLISVPDNLGLLSIQ
jgi:hypothetical protein